MASMRVIFLAFGLVAAAQPAAAQLNQFEIDHLRMQQQEAQRRAIDQENQLMSLEARLRAEQAVTDLQTQARLPPRVAGAPYETQLSPAPTGATLSSKMPSMPDAALADSNRKVQAASRR